MGRHPRWVRRFLSESELDEIARVIAEVERRTSGEIRVHLGPACPGDPVARAVDVFERLGMHRTAGRNGALIYVAPDDHKLAVIGDEGIHARVGQEYWERLVSSAAARFREGHACAGLVAAVREVGATLEAHFPPEPDDRDELSDAVSLG
jgi:uncharacterized membrane protein